MKKKKFIFKRYNTIGIEELNAVKRVVKSGELSSFCGSWPNSRLKNFYGGKEVLKFEKKICKFYNSKYAISVNSWTSGLIAAVGSLQISPGDEIITTPWTMCATATAILHWGAIPVFVDIEKYTFNINIDLIKSKISKKTKAIIVPEIFGCSVNMLKIKKIAKEHKLKIILDSAQSPMAKYKKKFTFQYADIGGFSYNCHKHVQIGEGGVLLTNDKRLAERMCLIRNHAEAVVGPKKIKSISNMIGYNFRMGEIEAALASEQLKKLKKMVNSRVKIANFFNKEFKNLNGLYLPTINNDFTHDYYIYAIRIDKEKIKLSRSKIIQIFRSAGLDIDFGYINLHLYPLFKKKIAYGDNHFPWVIGNTKSKVNYYKGMCPVAEELHDETLIRINMCEKEFNKKELLYFTKTFVRVWKSISKL